MSTATLHNEKIQVLNKQSDFKKTLVPQLRFKEFNGEWKVKKISGLLKEGRLGGNYENSESNNGIPVIKMGNLGRGEININKVQFLPENIEYNKEDILIKGDLLFNTRNTLELVGKVSIWREELPFALYNSNLMRMKFNNEIESSNVFMNYNFNTKNSINQLRRFATGTTSVAAIYGRDLKNFNVAFPSLAEQQKIASFLSVVEEKIQQLTRKVSLLEQYKKGVAQQLFSGKLRFNDENGKDYPEWEQKQIGKIYEHRNEIGFNEMKLLSISINKGIYSQSESNKKDNSNNDKSKYKRVLVGDIAYNSMRMWQGASSVSFLDGIVSPAYTVLKGNINNDSRYFGYLFKMPFMIQTFQKPSQGLTSDTWNLKYPMISKIKVKQPCLKEQQKNANFLSSIDSKIESVNQQLVQTQTFKKGLLQQMFV